MTLDQGQGWPGDKIGANTGRPEWTSRWGFAPLTASTYAVTAAFYIDPANNALVSNPATFTDGTPLVTLHGTATVTCSVPLADLAGQLGTQALGHIDYTFSDAFPLVDITAYTTLQGSGQSDWTIRWTLPVTAGFGAQMNAYHLLNLPATWAQGDFDGDGRVTVADYGLLPGASPVTVPEPSTLALLAAYLMALIWRRR